MGDKQPNWSISTALTTRMLRKIEALNIRWAKMRVESVDRTCMSNYYPWLFWSNGYGKMWDFVGKDENCVQ